MILARTSLAGRGLIAAFVTACLATISLAQLVPPVNDKCSGAIALTLNQAQIGNNINATGAGDGPISICNTITGTNGKAVWYAFTPSVTQQYQVSACHSILDSVLSVFSAVDCVNFDPAMFVPAPGGCNDDSCGIGATGGPAPGGIGGSGASLIPNITLTAGTTYYIRLMGNGGSGAGWYQIGVYDYVSAGACCSGDGYCFVTQPYGCSTIDSALKFMGGGTTCSPSPCLGACCNPQTLACTLTLPFTFTAVLNFGSSCIDSGSIGIFQGIGSTCTPAACSVGACCVVSNGGCNISLERSCTGGFRGVGTTCTTGICQSGVAACCNNSTFACSTGTYPCPAGTTSAGLGSACSPVNACASGACCSGTLICSISAEATCRTASIWRGPGTTCATTTCSAACCNTAGTGNCVVLALGSTCPTGYTFMGTATSCSPSPCAAGACCKHDGTCTLTIGNLCYTTIVSTSQFTYLGNGTVCSPTNPCLATMGACCSSTSVCTSTTELGCANFSTAGNSSGINLATFSGVGTSCATTDCNQYLGTCCSSSGGCSVTSVATCLGNSPTNTFMGVGVNVTTGTPSTCTSAFFCNSSLGSCCKSDNTCAVTMPLGCVGFNTFYTDATSCPAGYCNQYYSACCTGATCAIKTAAACAATSPPGVFQLPLGTNTSGTTCTSTTWCQSTSTYPGAADLGACCAAAAATACIVTTAANCATTQIGTTTFFAAGWSTGTTCTTGYCTTLPSLMVGSCCSSTGTCSVTTAIGCNGATQTFNGVGGGGYTSGTTCAPTTYCQSTTLMGACCSATGTCSATTLVGCTGTSVFQGLGTGYASGTACTPTTFCQRTNYLGACCTATGTCTTTTAAGCIGTSSHQGVGVGYASGTTCNPATYCQSTAIYGACCSIAGVCTTTTAAGCPSPSLYQGVGVGYSSGTACNPTTWCTDHNLLGACCNADGSCVQSTSTGCGGSSVFRAVGIACSADSCIGACCDASGACSMIAVGAACVGTAQPLGTTCTPNTCPLPPSGVCCRGTTCNTTLTQANCTATAPIGAVYITTSTVCNTGSNTTPCCYADFNKNGALQVQDIFDFLNAWFAGSLFSKVGGDGTSGTLAVADIFDFLNAWFAGGC